MSALRTSVVLVVLCAVIVLSFAAIGYPGCGEMERLCSFCHTDAARSAAPNAAAERHERSDANAAGILAVGFGLTSFCILAYRKSR